MRDLVLAAYKGPMTIDVLNDSAGKQRPIGNVKRPARSIRPVVQWPEAARSEDV
ncbi:hypothetical protein ACVBEH_01695 [Roseateles sp. GG27B]